MGFIMNRVLCVLSAAGLLGLVSTVPVDGRGFGGFGGFRTGGFGVSAGGYRASDFGSYGGFGTSGFGESVGGYRADDFGRYGGFGTGGFGESVGGYRTGGFDSTWRGGYGGTSYDRNWNGANGGSINVSGDRGAVTGPLGGFAAGGTRDVTATGPEGRTYSSDRDRGVAVGPYGRVVGGGSGSASASGPRGTADTSWQRAFSGTRFPTDLGLGSYSNFDAAGVRHNTTFWSNNYMSTRGAYVRSSFGYYNCFRPGWWARYPGCWYAAGWNAGAAWAAATYASVASFCAYPAVPIDYDYGSTVVYENNNVYVNGEQTATAEQYAQQATTLADQGQQANAPTDAEWKALGVFALVQGDDKSSNNIFQIALNKDGIIRGNYYDGLMDTTTPIFGSVDSKSQRAAWTIGKKNDRVFEAGVYNLTQSEAPVLVHIGTDRTQQMLLVRVQQPADQANNPYANVEGQ